MLGMEHEREDILEDEREVIRAEKDKFELKYTFEEEEKEGYNAEILVFATHGNASCYLYSQTMKDLRKLFHITAIQDTQKYPLVTAYANKADIYIFGEKEIDSDFIGELTSSLFKIISKPKQVLVLDSLPKSAYFQAQMCMYTDVDLPETPILRAVYNIHQKPLPKSPIPLLEEGNSLQLLAASVMFHTTAFGIPAAVYLSVMLQGYEVTLSTIQIFQILNLNSLFPSLSGGGIHSQALLSIINGVNQKQGLIYA